MLWRDNFTEHLLSKESLEDHGKLLVDPPSRTTIVVGQNASVVSCWLTLVTKARHLPFVWLLWRDNFAEHLLSKESLEERGKLLVDPPSTTTIVVGQNASVVSCWLLLSRSHLPSFLIALER